MLAEQLGQRCSSVSDRLLGKCWALGLILSTEKKKKKKKSQNVNAWEKGTGNKAIEIFWEVKDWFGLSYI
jgi:hypothetical protein